MSSFLANIGWERPRKRENKKNCPDGFLPDLENEIQKKQQKIHKTIKHDYGFFSSQNGLQKDEKERK